MPPALRVQKDVKASYVSASSNALFGGDVSISGDLEANKPVTLSNNLFEGFTPTSTSGSITLTPQQLIDGQITCNTSGAAITLILPSAAQLVAAIPHSALNKYFKCVVRNTATNAGNQTVVNAAAGDTSWLVQTTAIPVNTSSTLLVYVTNNTAGQEAARIIEAGNSQES